MASQRPKPLRKRFRFLAVSLSLGVLSALLPPPTASANVGQWLWWSEEGNSFTTFGPNATITIDTGRMVYTTLCSRSEGEVDTFFTPWTDVYIVPSGSVSLLSELEDVSGTANTVQGMTTSGGFIAETIGRTSPTGDIGPGTYAVVYDECQDGYLDVEDALFDPAFTVSIPDADVPPLPGIDELKEKAELAQQFWEKFRDQMEKWFDSATKADIGNKQSQFWWGAQRLGPLTDPRRATLAQMANMAKHYEGIAADPPDPNFQQITELVPRTVVDPASDDPLQLAAALVGTQASIEGNLAEGLLHSLERYQGADAATNGNWALVHAFAIQDYANALALQMGRTNAALGAYGNALASDPRDWDAIAADLQAFRDRVAAQGFSPEEIQEARNLGMTDAEIEQARADLLASDFAFTRAEMIADLNGALANNNAMMDALEALFNAMQTNVSQLQTSPYWEQVAPLANPGGPYTVNQGAAVTLNGTGSVSPYPITTYQWDLDNDGAFDDATGATPSATFPQAFRGFVGLKVTNQEGHSNVAYGPITVNPVNRPPHIGSRSPEPTYQTVEIGSSRAFTVTASDPDSGQSVTTRWLLDGNEVGQGASYTYAPAAGDLGLHVLDAYVRDSYPSPNSSRTRWLVEAVQPDQDGDGWRSNIDCRDDDPAVNPGRTEVPGNGKDDDCNPETPDTPETPPLQITPPAGQSAEEGTAASFTLGSLADGTPNGPYTVEADWGDSSAPTSLTLDAPGEISAQSHTYADSGTYTVTLQASELGGESDSKSFEVTVANLPPTGSITAPPSVRVGEAIPVAVVNAADPSPADMAAGLTFAFDCGDGQGYGPEGSASSAECAAADTAGSRTVKARIRDKDGAASEYTAAVAVGSAAIPVTAPADQAADEGTAASFDLGSFTDGTPGGPYTVAVDWGDGSAPTDLTMNAPGAIPAQSHSYADNGVYPVTVTVAEGTAESGTAAFQVAVANQAPTAVLEAPASVATGDSYQLALTGAADPSPTDTAAGFGYAFDCGDGAGYGAFGAAETATCPAGSAAGTRTVRAQVRDKDGATAEYSATVQITAPSTVPTAFFTPNGVDRNVAQAEMGATVHSFSSIYSNSYRPEKALTRSTNDGYWATKNWTTTGWLKVDLPGDTPWVVDRVRVMPGGGGEGVKDFAIAVSEATAEDADFVPVLTARTTNAATVQEFALPEPVQAKYILYTALTNWGSSCCVGTQSLQVMSDQFSTETVTFQNGSTDPEEDIVSYHWDFGDNDSSTEENPTHTFPGPGTYTVTLTVTDGAGNTDTFSLAHTILQAPVPSFAVTTSNPREGSGTALADTSTDPDNGGIAAWEWDWGDGSQPGRPTAPTTSHTFPDNGTYQVTLKVTDDQGQTASIQQPVVIGNALPTANTGGGQTVLFGVPVVPNSSASDPGAADRPTLQCAWDLGDGTTVGPGPCSEQQFVKPSHAYDRPGIYNRTLTVTDKDGGSHSSTSQVSVGAHRSRVTYRGPRTASAGESILLQARLWDLDLNQPVANRPITFSVAGETLTGTTDGDGIATATLNGLAQGSYPVRVESVTDEYYPTADWDLDLLLVDVAGDALVTPSANLSPTELTCREATTVTLAVTGTPPTTQVVPLDVALVIDVSGSMSGPKMIAAKEAAAYFTQIVDAESDGSPDGQIRSSQVAVVPFDGAARVEANLTGDAATLAQKISRLGAGGSTAIHAGINFGQAELVSGGKPANKPVIILLSDGESDRAAAKRAADLAKAAGTEIFSIGLGAGASEGVLREVASEPKGEHYYFAPEPDDLEQIYRQIANSATGPAATDLLITAQVDPAFTLDPASVSPAPASVSGSTITWTVPQIVGETLSFSYRIAPQAGGILPVHQSATVQYTDTRGQRQTADFPVLTATVICGTNLTYQGDLEGVAGATAHLAARLTDQTTGQPLADQALSFELGGLAATAQTNGDGVGAAELLLNLTPGVYPLTVRFAGDAAHQPAESTVSFTVLPPAGETQPPVTTITPAGEEGENGWWTSAVTVTLTAVDQPSGSPAEVAATEYSLDNGATWQAYSGPFTLADDGTHTVMARSRDTAGNQEDPAVAAEIRIDKTPPEVAAEAADGVEGTAVALDASATTDATAGVDKVEWDLDGDGTFETDGATVSHAWPDNGTYTVTVRATDEAGNEAEAPVTVEIANAAPEVEAPDDQNATAGEEDDFDLGTFDDPGADAPWAVAVDWGDGSDPEETTADDTGSLGTAAHTYAAPGTYTVTVTVTDKDGAADSDTFEVTAEDAPQCEPVDWKSPLSADGITEVGLADTLDIRFSYNGCDQFVRDESVIITVYDEQAEQEVTTWVYDLDITIDEDAEEYRVAFDPSAYGLADGQELVILVFMQGEPVGEATIRMVP